MGSSSLSEDYRQCLERELRRGRAGVCGDPSLRAVLWQILVEDFDLHGALQDDALALFTDGLWGRADLAPALQDLARAFELLELAAVHLYLLPWRKEFTTIKTFSGGYVHVLKGVLSEELLTRSFQKMGYVRRDNHRLMATYPPSAVTPAASSMLPTALPYLPAARLIHCAFFLVTTRDACGCNEHRWITCSMTVLGPIPRPRWTPTILGTVSMVLLLEKDLGHWLPWPSYSPGAIQDLQLKEGRAFVERSHLVQSQPWCSRPSSIKKILPSHP